MKNIALTGTIGSGKTLICSVFERLGVPVFVADKEAIRLYKDPRFLNEIASEFGNEVLENGLLNKKALANIVFTDNKKLDKLNSMVHPRVLEMYNLWQKKQKATYTIMESAIVFEIGWDKKFDKIISVDSPKNISIERAMKRDNLSFKEIEERMNNQLTNEDKSKRADYIIHHDNKTMLLPQILEINNQLITKT